MWDGCSRDATGVAAEALAGLTAPRKTLPAKLFYDAEGCRLFELITRLDEYYVTRTEMALLGDVAGAVADFVPGGALVEYGASREDKAAILLRAFAAGGRPLRSYVPVDVAAAALAALAERMARSHPGVQVTPVAADFMEAIELPETACARPRLGFFPGSTIGNLEPVAAAAFLSRARHTLGADAHFLVGVDLRKDPKVLEAAYDDRQGVTAAFNRNLLVRLNREAAADFDLEAFAHRAVWNDAESRIEMHLVSLRPQTVQLAGRTIGFAAGETIHTENSYKHTVGGFAAMAGAGGWAPLRVWTDKAKLFSLHLLRGRS